jgi:hypothetical protein
MSGPKRNPDKLNTIGVVVVGICGAVLVYVTIVALQAFYMNNTSEIQTMADYGGQDLTAKGRRADEMRNITEAGKNAVGQGQEVTFRIPIEHAMKLVVEDAKKDASHLVPALPPSTKPSIEPVFGRPKPAAPPGGAAPAGAGSAAPAAGSAAVDIQAAPQSPTGQPGMPQPVAGAGGVPSGGSPTGTPQVGSAGSTPAGAKATQQQPKTPAPAPNPATTPAQPKSPTQPASDATKAKTPAPKAEAQPKATPAPAKGSAAPKTP